MSLIEKHTWCFNCDSELYRCPREDSVTYKCFRCEASKSIWLVGELAGNIYYHYPKEKDA